MSRPSFPSPTNPVAVSPSPGDDDGDGLLDAWERANARFGVRVGRADVLVRVATRPNIPFWEIRSQLETAKDFYSKIPIRNRDGSTGVNLIVLRHPRIDGAYVEKLDANQTIAYSEARPAILGDLPAANREFRGMLIGCSTAGGGQTEGWNYATAGNHWASMAHEIGHMFGLQHQPRSAPAAALSPFYASLMNYDYNFHFKDSEDLVQFSRGELSTLDLDETNIREILPFFPDTLDFLTFGPHHFAILSESIRGTSCVDFNRNGRCDTEAVRADVNGGREVILDSSAYKVLGHSLGDVALATHGDLLIAVIMDNSAIADKARFIGKRPLVSTIKAVAYDPTTRTLTELGSVSPPSDARGPPAIAVSGDLIFVAYPTVHKGSIRLRSLRLQRVLGALGLHAVRDFEFNPFNSNFWTVDVSLAIDTSRRELRYFARQLSFELPIATGAVSIADIASSTDTPPRFTASILADRSGARLRSSVVPAVAYSAHNDRFLLIRTDAERSANAETARRQHNRLLLTELVRTGGDLEVSRTVVLNDGFPKTVDRIAIVHRPPIETGGRDNAYFVFVREFNPDLPDLVVNGTPRRAFILRLELDVAQSEAHEIVSDVKRVGNEWTWSRSAPAVAYHQSDLYIIHRAAKTDTIDPPDPEENQVHLHPGANSIWTRHMTDFDDIGYLATEGLRRR